MMTAGYVERLTMLHKNGTLTVKSSMHVHSEIGFLCWELDATFGTEDSLVSQRRD